MDYNGNPARGLIHNGAKTPEKLIDVILFFWYPGGDFRTNYPQIWRFIFTRFHIFLSTYLQ